MITERINADLAELLIPHCANPHAVALGRMAAGKPKNFSPAELAKRRDRLAIVRAKRWPEKKGALNSAMPA